MTGVGAGAGVALASAVARTYDPKLAAEATADGSGAHPISTFPGANDNERLTNAMSYQAAQVGRPPIIISARDTWYDWTSPHPLYSGAHLIGPPGGGPKNLELASGAYVPAKVKLGGSVTSGASSLFVAPAGVNNIYNVFMGGFGVQGSLGSSVHQFLDFPLSSGTLYACEFWNLGFNFMRGLFGRKPDRKCAVTQVIFSGHWVANNLWDTQFYLGGSDADLFGSGYINIGVSQSPAQTGTFADNDYMIILESLSKYKVGYIYLTALNGWRGLKVLGNSGTSGGLFSGGIYEGYKSGTPAPGTLVRLEGGRGKFDGVGFGYGMGAPDPAEGGLIHITGGEWEFDSPTFWRGARAETAPVIFHTGGRVSVKGAHTASGEAWTGRPRYRTTAPSAPGPNAGSYAFYCPDLSMQAA